MVMMIARFGLVTQVKYFVIILFIMTHFRALSACQSSSGVLTIDPHYAVEKEGDFLNFTCRSKKQSSGFITTYINPALNNSEVSELYDPAKDEITLIITVNVSKSVQYFRCDVRSALDQHICFSSRLAQLRPEYFPKKNELSCGPRNSEKLRQGDVLRIFCEVSRSNPAVDMRWKLFPDATLLPFPPHRDGSVYRTLSLELTITKDFHLKKLVCEVTSEMAFPGRLLQCVVGPIKVYHAPNVVVHPPKIVVLQNGQTSFLCVVDGYPDHFTFIWSCLPDGIFVGCDSISATADISTRIDAAVPPEGIDAEIICRASNSVGQATGSSYVKVLPFIVSPNMPSVPAPPTIVEPHVPSQENVTLSIEVQKLNETLSESTEDVTVSCYLENITIFHETVEIQWHFDGAIKPHKKENISCRITQTSPFRSNITCSNPLGHVGRNPPSEIYCSVVLDKLTYTSSVINLTQNIGNSKQFPKPYHATDIVYTASPTTFDYRSSSLSLPNGIVTFSLLVAMGALVLMACIVALLVYVKYRLLKITNSNDAQSGQELSIRQADNENHCRSEDFDPVYDFPNLESDPKLPGLSSFSSATRMYPYSKTGAEESVGNTSSYYCSTSYSSSSDGSHSSSDVYLEPNRTSISPDAHSD